MNGFYNRHYILTDPRGCITAGWSDGPTPKNDSDKAICINSQGGYQFRLFPGGEENPPLHTMDGIPLYRWDGSQVVERTPEEIEADRAARPAPETTPQEDADAMLVDHEYRLTLLELGVTEGV